jgi:hypothetical protein
MRATFKKFIHDDSGVAYIELAISAMTLTIILFGLVEISAFMRVKNKMNQVADQMGAVLGTIPNWQPDIYVRPYLGAAEYMARPFGVAVSVRYCAGGTDTNIPFQTTINSGDCSLGVGGGGGVFEEADCLSPKLDKANMFETIPTVQFVVVTASCRYVPYLNYLNLFGDTVVTSTSVTPMRYKMQW